MLSDDGKKGASPGNTRHERQERAKAGAFSGKQYPNDGVRGERFGAPPTRLAGAGTSFSKAQPINTPRSSNSPYTQQQKVKPGSGL